MLDPKIFTGGQSVLASGSVVSIGGRPIVFNPLPTPFEEYTVEILFTTSVTVPEMSINISPVPPLLFRITLTNFNNISWSSTRDQLYVANHAGRKIMFHFATCVIGVGDTATRLFCYTFFDGGLINV